MAGRVGKPSQGAAEPTAARQTQRMGSDPRQRRRREAHEDVEDHNKGAANPTRDRCYLRLSTTWRSRGNLVDVGPFLKGFDSLYCVLV